jgi:hypothetical protein
MELAQLIDEHKSCKEHLRALTIYTLFRLNSQQGVNATSGHKNNYEKGYCVLYPNYYNYITLYDDITHCKTLAVYLYNVIGFRKSDYEKTVMCSNELLPYVSYIMEGVWHLVPTHFQQKKTGYENVVSSAEVLNNFIKSPLFEELAKTNDGTFEEAYGFHEFVHTRLMYDDDHDMFISFVPCNNRVRTIGKIPDNEDKQNFINDRLKKFQQQIPKCFKVENGRIVEEFKEITAHHILTFKAYLEKRIADIEHSLHQLVPPMNHIADAITRSVDDAQKQADAKIRKVEARITEHIASQNTELEKRLIDDQEECVDAMETRITEQIATQNTELESRLMNMFEERLSAHTTQLQHRCEAQEEYIATLESRLMQMEKQQVDNRNTTSLHSVHSLRQVIIGFALCMIIVVIMKIMVILEPRHEVATLGAPI